MIRRLVLCLALLAGLALLGCGGNSGPPPPSDSASQDKGDQPKPNKKKRVPSPPR
jgi:hypothetical protein